MTRRTQRDDEGFTLIELLIVIVILGVLAGIVVFAVGGINDRGDSSACKQDKRTIETAIEAYQTQKGATPDSLTDLIPAFLRSDPGIAADKKVTPGYVLEYRDGAIVTDCPVAGDGTPEATPSPESTSSPSPTALAAPTGVSASRSGTGNSTTITGTWSRVSGLTYECLIHAASTAPDSGEACPEAGSYVKTNQSNSQNRFSVRAVDGARKSVWTTAQVS